MTVTIYADDPEAFWDFTVTSRDGADLDWATPLVAAGSGDYLLSGTWQGTAGPTRDLRVPLDTLAVGLHNLYLRVPGGTDFLIGQVYVAERR